MEQTKTKTKKKINWWKVFDITIWVILLGLIFYARFHGVYTQTVTVYEEVCNGITITGQNVNNITGLIRP